MIELAAAAHLPELVCSYLDRSLPPEPALPAMVRVRQTGEMWKKPGARAMAFEATEHFAVDRVAFSWRAHFPIVGPLGLRVVDGFGGGDVREHPPVEGGAAHAERLGRLGAGVGEPLHPGRLAHDYRRARVTALFLGPPKTRASRRRVDLSSTAAHVLRRQLLARKPNERGLVFPSPRGDILNDDNVRHRVFAPAVRRSGLKRVRFHDLRHTYAALMVAAGAHPKYLQAQMGRSSIRVTLDLYGHLFPDASRGALDNPTRSRTIHAPSSEPRRKPSQRKSPGKQGLSRRERRDSNPRPPA